ncbi:hypothetical protein HMPREF9078_00434 [Capnocytophaga sp. oral taxon 380 str. F0488]|nr:hypothetical protein HMPREF9078_00434 [Capnocytophaga sp. oral taxon 380 str. F0488]
MIEIRPFFIVIGKRSGNVCVISVDIPFTYDNSLWLGFYGK